LSQHRRGDRRRRSPANARLTGSDRRRRETGGKRSGAALEVVEHQWRLRGVLAYAFDSRTRISTYELTTLEAKCRSSQPQSRWNIKGTNFRLVKLHKHVS